MKQTTNSGYILVLTLMIVSVLVVIVTSMVFNETAHSALTKTIVDRERAKMVALGGVQLAISQLTIRPKKTEEKKEGTQGAKNEPAQKPKEESEASQKTEVKLLKNIMPSLNRWQNVNLTEKSDGIDGQIKFCIMSENGKININQLYDFAKHKFIGEQQLQQNQQPQQPGGPNVPPQPQMQPQQFDAGKFMRDMSSKIRDFAQKDVFRGLQQFLQNRKFPLNDVTELLEIPEFAYFKEHVFYEPTLSDKKVKRPIYLTDIFTTWTTNNKIQPLLLSDSVSELFGLKRAEQGDLEQRKKQIDQLLKNFKSNFYWKTDWDKLLKPIFGKEFNMLNKQIEYLLDSQFGPKSFSVLSYGIVGEVTQRIFAIVEIESSGNNTEGSVVKIKKLYWI